MIATLLVLILFILLFGASVVKGWLVNIAGFGMGGLILLLLTLKLGSYLGEYGPLWVIGIVAAVIAGGFAIGIHFEERPKREALKQLADLQREREALDRKRRRLP